MAGRAIVFAGQGAQFVGMGKELADSNPEYQELFDRADEILGYGLSRICFEGPAEELTKTNHCQPGIFVASVVCYRALMAAVPGLQASCMAGLSLGEWTALHAAGALTFDDTLRVLEARGRFMQDACDQSDGAMVSVIGLSVDQLKPICEKTGVSMANLNSAQQTVLSGDRTAIEQAEQLANEAGAKKTIILKVAGAYHSPLMEPAAQRLKEVLDSVDIQPTSVPVVANVTGAPHGTPDEIRETMLKQVTSSVLWQADVEWLRGQGIEEFVECGPGKVLSSLIKRIDRSAQVLNIQDAATLEAAVAALA